MWYETYYSHCQHYIYVVQHPNSNSRLCTTLAPFFVVERLFCGMLPVICSTLPFVVIMREKKKKARRKKCLRGPWDRTYATGHDNEMKKF